MCCTMDATRDRLIVDELILEFHMVTGISYGLKPLAEACLCDFAAVLSRFLNFDLPWK